MFYTFFVFFRNKFCLKMAWNLLKISWNIKILPAQKETFKEFQVKNQIKKETLSSLFLPSLVLHFLIVLKSWVVNNFLFSLTWRLQVENSSKTNSWGRYAPFHLSVEKLRFTLFFTGCLGWFAQHFAGIYFLLAFIDKLLFMQIFKRARRKTGI